MSSGRDPAVRVYRALLLLYPRRYRRRWGEEMVRVFRAERRALPAGSWVGVRHAVGAFADAVRSAGAERTRGALERWRAGETPSGNARRSENRRRPVFEDVRRDVRHALRAFRRSPAFAAVAVLTIALGIGANTAIFSVVRAVLLRPLPYDDAERLVLVWGELVNRDIQHWPTSPPDLLVYQEQVPAFEQLEAVFTFAQPLTGGDADPEQVEVGAVTPGLLAMLGARTAAGRLFVAEDATPVAPDTPPGEGPPAIVVLSHELWQRRYGGDPDVVGRTIDLGQGALVVGILEPGFRLYMPPGGGVSNDIDLWLAPRLDPATANRNNVFLRMIGKLEAGATIALAQQQLNVAVERIKEVNERAATAGLRQEIVPLHQDLTREVRPIVLALLGAVGFVLLIACANVSNLLLVRASAREREMAVRAALGGSRASIVRQVLTESLVLAFAGGALGLLLAAGGIRALLALQPPDLPRIDTVTIDAVVLGYAALAATVAAVIFGLIPAVQSSRADLARLLKDRSASAGGRAQGALRGTVVVLEVALSLVLLIGAGLMVRSFVALRDVDPGYDAERVLTFDVPLPFARYQTTEQRVQFGRQLHDRLAALPGVTAVGGGNPLPLTGTVANGPYGTEDVLSDPNRFQQADVRVVTPDYFATMGTRVLEGRVFTEADRNDSTGYVVVDRTLARRTWPDEPATGKRLMIRFGGPDYVPVQVIGVVEHQRNGSLAEEGRETIYYLDTYAGEAFGGLTWLLRTNADPAALASGARRVVAELDPLLPVVDLQPMQHYVDAAMGPTRFALALIGIFGVTALVLTAVGLYGVLAYTVRQRTAEIGIRMTFGAGAESILRMVVGQGLRLAAAGVVLGVLGAVALTRVIESQLVGVEATDPLTFVAVAAVFLAIAAVACAIPALRATRVDPLTALRQE